jgi:hypothetical protein
MQDSKNYIIGVLSITATILLVGLLLATGHGNQAYAIGQIDRGGDYIMVTGQFTDSMELIYVTDAAAQRINAYSWETTTQTFVLWDSLDLPKLLRGN